jgi:integrase
MHYRNEYTLLPVKRKQGGIVYYVRFYDPSTGRRTKVSTGESSIGRARTWADNHLGDGLQISPRLEDFASNFFKWGECPWIKRQHAKGRPFSESHAKTRRGHLEKYIIPQFGKRRLDEMTLPVVENWLVGLQLANQTKNHMLYTMKILFREAEAQKLIRSDPLEKAEPMGHDSRARDVFTMDELRVLFPKNRRKLLEIWKSQRWSTLFMVLATTGIRQGEARALTWRHLLPGGWLHIEQAVKRNGDIGVTKTGAVRVVALPERTRKELERWRTISPFTALDNLIFFGASPDKPLGVASVTHFLPRALSRAGCKTAGRNLPVHSLRHTYNTVMRHVLPEETLRKFTGHKTPGMTDLYDHPRLEDQIGQLQSARALVESVWGDRRAKKRS